MKISIETIIEINKPSNDILITKGLSPNTKEIYNHDRMEMLKSSFDSLKVNIPFVIIELIGGYDFYHDNSVDELYKKVMEWLNISKEKAENELNFYNPLFASQLLKSLKRKKGKSSFNHDPFWYDFYKFIFKWTLAMRRIFAINDEAFEEAVKSVKLIIIIIDGMITNSFGNLDSFLNSPRFDFSIFQELIKYELYDDPLTLEKFIKQIIKNSCNDKGELKISCQELKNKYFDGNFNNNPLLKLALFYFAPKSIRNLLNGEECFSNGENSNFDQDHLFTKALLKLYSPDNNSNNNASDLLDVGNVLEIVHENYINGNTIKFFLENKLGFRIYSPLDLVFIIKRLIRMNLLINNDIFLLQQLIKFRIENEEKLIWTWDSANFKSHLQDGISRHNELLGEGLDAFQYNLDKYDNLI